MKSYIIILFLFQVLSGIAQENTNFKVTCYPTKSDYFNKSNGYEALMSSKIRAFGGNSFMGANLLKLKLTSIEDGKRIHNGDVYAVVVDTITLVNLAHFTKYFGFGYVYNIDTFSIVNTPGNNRAYDTHYSFEPILFSANSDKIFELTIPNVRNKLKSLKNKDALNQFNNEKVFSIRNLVIYFQYYLKNLDDIDPNPEPIFKDKYPND